jgi:hypothetical protein
LWILPHNLPVAAWCGSSTEVQFQHQEKCMRVDFTSIPQSQIESAKTVDKKEINGAAPGSSAEVEDEHSFIPFSLGSGRTYSLSSLKAAVDYHAKFLTVAESNMAAVNHAATIPKGILESLNRR